MRWWLAATVAVMVGATAQAEEARPSPGVVAPQDQVILNPEPDHTAPSPVRQGIGDLAGLAPEAGAATACAEAGGWRVVVVRGSQAPDVVRGHMITIADPDC